MKYLVLLSCLILLFGCSKKDATSPATAHFQDYTGRDAKGMLFGPIDTTDWTLDTTWNSTETGLFSKYNLSFNQQTVVASMWKPALRPNPVAVGSQSTLVITVDKANPSVPAAVRMAFAVVDANYTILSWGDVDDVNKQFGAVITHEASKYKGNTLYRLYYVVYDELNLHVYYKGHGDIQL